MAWRINHSVRQWFLSLALVVLLSGAVTLVWHLGNQELFLLLLGLLTLLLLSALLTGFCLIQLKPSGPTSSKIMPGWVDGLLRTDLRWEFQGKVLPVDLSVSDGIEVVDSIRSRMWLEGVERVIRLKDPCGLFVWERRGDIPNAICRHPEGMQAKGSPRLIHAAGGSFESPAGKAAGDPTDSRYYQTGDSTRRILWSVVARQGGLARAGNRLMVRSDEKVMSRRIGIFFLPGGEDEKAAGFVRSCLEKNLLGDDWVFSTPGLAKPIRRDCTVALREIDRSGVEGLPPPVGSPSGELSKFCRDCFRNGISSVFLIAGEEFLSSKELANQLLEAVPNLRILAIRSAQDKRFLHSSRREINLVEVFPATV